MKKRSLAIVKRYGATAQRSGGAVRTEKLVRRGQRADRAPRSFIVGQVLTEGRYAHAEPSIKQSLMIPAKSCAGTHDHRFPHSTTAPISLQPAKSRSSRAGSLRQARRGDARCAAQNKKSR